MRTSPAVRGRGITKSFGEVVALDGVALDVASGQVHGLAGPNGAGKTTLLGLLLGLAVADAGSLEILGTPVGRTLEVPDGVAGFVDGHRAPIQIISPWARHGGVDSRYYSQITMIRTIEQILGTHPMNQKESAATPMSGAFTGRPDNTPYTALPNRTSLTLGLPAPPPCGADTVAQKYAAAQPSVKVPARERQVAAQWQEWKTHQRLTGPRATADYANPAQMNHFTWYQTHGWAKPYPGETKVYTPDRVPGAYIPPSGSDD